MEVVTVPPALVTHNVEQSPMESLVQKVIPRGGNMRCFHSRRLDWIPTSDDRGAGSEQTIAADKRAVIAACSDSAASVTMAPAVAAPGLTKSLIPLRDASYAAGVSPLRGWTGRNVEALNPQYTKIILRISPLYLCSPLSLLSW